MQKRNKVFEILKKERNDSIKNDKYFFFFFEKKKITNCKINSKSNQIN